MSAETFLSVLVGIGLSAACGFRVFVPMLVMSIASFSGHLTLSPGFEWIGQYPALLAFAIAAVVEIAGYFIPYVDHLLDLVAGPAATVAGIVAMASTVTGMSPFLRWACAIIAGGGIAATAQLITSVTRVASTAATAGLGNPAFSAVETGGAFFFSMLAIVIPVIAVPLIAIFLALAYWPGRALLQRRRLARSGRANASAVRL